MGRERRSFLSTLTTVLTLHCTDVGDPQLLPFAVISSPSPAVLYSLSHYSTPLQPPTVRHRHRLIIGRCCTPLHLISRIDATNVVHSSPPLRTYNSVCTAL